MICDVLLEGFRDEYDFAIVRIREATGDPRVISFMRGNPIPQVVIEDGVREFVESSGVTLPAPLDGERLWLIAVPVFGGEELVVVADEAEEEFEVRLGAARIGRDPQVERWVFAHGELFQTLHDVVSQRVGDDSSRLWDSGVYPKGPDVVVRYRVVLAAPDGATAERLEAETLMIAALDDRARRHTRPFAVLEDAMVEAEGFEVTGAMNRELTVAVTMPADNATGCLWVWSRVLGRGVFRGMASWMLRPRLAWFSMVSAPPEVDPHYDAWAHGQGQARAFEGGLDAGSTAGLEGVEPPKPSGLPHLTVLVAEDVEGEAGCGPTTIQETTLADVAERLKPNAQRAALMRTISSLGEQTHQGFNVVWVPKGEALGAAAAASESWCVVLGAGDILEPCALERLAQEAASSGDATLIYADEDRYELEGDFPRLVGARLKPAFSTDELYWGNGVGLPMAVAPTLRAPEACTAYDLALAALEAGGPGGVRKIDGVLLHAVHSRPFATVASARSLQRHLGARGLAAHVSYLETNVADDPLRAPGGVLRVRYLRPDPCPLVSIIIPNRDQAHYLGPCVDSILELTEWPNFEIVIVENGSRRDETLELYRELQERDGRVRVVSWTGKSFNYSAVVNRGASKAKGEFLCLLNNDTKVLSGDWLDELVGPLARPELGVTGALLTFEDGLVQHAGMVAVPSGGFGHMQQNLWPGEPADPPFEGADGYLMSLKRPVAYPMVTGACQVMRQALFDELGGYDEALAVGYNDGDFCLRAKEAGYGTLFVPWARLWHKEFGTRHRETDNVEDAERQERERAIMHERYPQIFERDPFLNRALDPDSRYFRLIRPYDEMEL